MYVGIVLAKTESKDVYFYFDAYSEQDLKGIANKWSENTGVEFIIQKAWDLGDDPLERLRKDKRRH